MTPSLRRRLAAICAAIAALASFAGWSAYAAWRELGYLRHRLTVAEFEGFRIAGELQAHVTGLTASLLAGALSDGGDWQRFEKDGAALNTWIDLQRSSLKTPREKRVLAEIDVEYDRYLAVARTIRSGRGERAASLAARIHPLDEAAQRMLALAGRLADAHRAALGDLLGESQRSLQRLELLFGAGFVILLGMGAWGARWYFEENIAPLRRRLVEVQQLAERREKLASLGVLAAGVAHEIRNPLTALKTRAFTLRRKLAADSPALGDAAIIDREIDRLERIVEDFLQFARPGDPQLVTMPPGALLSAVHELLAAELEKNGIALVVEAGGTPAFVRVDPHQIEQVLINLVRNGAESIGQRGRIALRVRGDRLPLTGRSREVVVLEVEDSGMGIPPEVQARLFDPFFTTKPAGTGLGLPIAMRILERHGGTLQFQTEPGHGTTFGVVLPAQPAAGSDERHCGTTGDGSRLSAQAPFPPSMRVGDASVVRGVPRPKIIR